MNVLNILDYCVPPHHQSDLYTDVRRSLWGCFLYMFKKQTVFFKRNVLRFVLSGDLSSAVINVKLSEASVYLRLI